MKKISIKNNRGFTLLESVLYLAIVAIVLTAVISFHLVLGGTASKLSSNIEVSQNMRTAVSSIDYLIKNSAGLLRDTEGSCSDFSTSSAAVLGLYFDDDTYLPGTCVQNGGGVMLTVSSTRLVMTCYPNIANNGQFQSCDPTSFGNNYYLTSPNVIVRNSGLTFATSTATSTSNNLQSITTGLTIETASQDQTDLSASLSTTSTVTLRNESFNGLVSWYKFDDAAGTTAKDSVGNNDLTCTGNLAPSAGIVDGSAGSFDFNVAESDYCYVDNPDNFNFSNAFSISAWIKMNYVANGHQSIFFKSVYADNQGYRLRVHYNTLNLYLRLCDFTACTDVLTAGGVIADATVYHVAAIYDLDNDIAKMYVYQKGAGGISTTTASSIPILVNTSEANYPRIGDSFDGQIDELKIYNRALSDSEVWALQSQGAN